MEFGEEIKWRHDKYEQIFKNNIMIHLSSMVLIFMIFYLKKFSLTE